MRLVLIRHAESTWNASGRWQGQSDVPLSPRGQLQVRALASRLWELEADRLICSDLQRAQHTAMAIGDPEPDPRFREIDVGEWAGLKRSEVAERFAEQVRALRSGEPVRIGGGESMPEFEARVDAGIDAIRGGDGKLVLVTHGGVIRALATRVLGLRGRPSSLVGVSNTSLTVLRVDGSQMALERYNDARHLDPGDQGSGMIRMPEPATRIAIIAAAPEEPDDRELTDAILAGLGIPIFFAPEETLEEPLASSLMAEPIEPTEAMTEQLRVDYEDSSVGLVVRPEAARRMVERLAGLREGGLSPMTHGAVAQLRLSERGAELHSYGVRPALR